MSTLVTKIWASNGRLPTSSAESAGLRRERTLASKRYRDGRFHNTEPLSPTMGDGRSLLSTAGEYFFSGREKRPNRPLPIDRPLEAWQRSPVSGLRVTWLGHSTTLLEIDGVRVLTDPVWSQRISPIPLVGPSRFHRPPVSIAELPPLDVIVLSHDHFDHLDAETVRTLAALRTPFVTSLGVGARLEALGVGPADLVELDWWEEVIVQAASSDLRIVATPARHFSGRSLFDRNATLWSSFALSSSRRSVFFSGDTGLTAEFATIRERLGSFDLVMLEIGAFHPAWGQIHLGPDNALKAHQLLGGGALLPVHWGTFDLALHAWDDPIEQITAARSSDLHLLTPRLGRPTEPAHVEVIDPWWREPSSVPALERADKPVAMT